jgi:hypothetical protein
MSTVRVTYYGVDGEGRNVTEAKRDAGTKIEAAMTGSYSPTVLQSRGTAIVLWRDPWGWQSCFLSHKGEFREHKYGLNGCSHKDYYEAYASALMSLAQDTWDGSEMVPPCLAEVEYLAKLGKKLMDRDTAGRRLLGDFRSWRGFQLAYQHAKAHEPELPEHQWHQWSCERGHLFADKPKGWAMVEGGAVGG